MMPLLHETAGGERTKGKKWKSTLDCLWTGGGRHGCQSHFPKFTPINVGTGTPPFVASLVTNTGVLC